jgi:hypothetical protein
MPILAVVFSSLGLALALAAGISAAVVAANSGDRHADGTVVELIGGRPGYGKDPYRPVVEFAAPSGTAIRFTGSIGSVPPAFQVGEHVDVRYDPDNPHDAVIDTYWQVWFVPTLIGLIGAPFLLVGLAFGIVTLARRRRAIHRLSHRT